MPLIRKILGERLGAKVDFSLDPMTVVARGAAMYATGVKRDTGTNEVPRPMPGRVPIRLDYEPVSIMPRPLVAGCVEMGGAINGKEIKIDAEGGFWTSGWTPLAPDGFFQLEVTPQETKRSTQFTIQVRDASGRVLPTEPPSFQILRGLTPGSPPLPHAIWVEIARPDGSSGLDPVFRRGDPLPAKATVKYRASAALRPNEPGQFLAVKLWEGEVADDPDANTWVGHVRLYSQHIRRPIPEGAEIELTVRLDASRKVTVEAFVPHLNQHFTEELWLPQAEQPVPDMKEVAPEIETNFERIDGLVSRLRELDDREAEAEVERIRLAVEELHAEAVVSNAPSADAAARLRDRSRRLRGELAKVERSLGSPPDERKTNQGDIFKVAEAAAAEWGSPAQKKEVALLQRDLSRANECKDERAQQRAIQSLESIRWAVLFQQDWFWKEIFDSIRAPDQRFRNHEEAKVWLEAGAAAYSADNGPEIRKAVQELWKLQEPAVVDAQKQSALKAGVKKY
jgi:molecular chaperone DnaK